MKQIKFMQAVYEDGKFKEWHYWGVLRDGELITPVGRNRIDDHYQFTGLLDKNGAEIYDGHIVRCWEEGMEDFADPTIHQIKYMGECQDYPAFDLVPHVEVESNGISYYLCGGSIEIIGHMVTDSHLLEVKK